MTCAIGLITEHGVVMGTDSCSSDGFYRNIATQPKYAVRGDYCIMGCGSWRIVQLLQAWQPPEYKPVPSAYQHLIETFIPALRAMIIEAGAIKVTDQRYLMENDTSLLLSVDGQLCVVHSDFQINMRAGPYDAIGSGMYHALGCLRTLCTHYTREVSPTDYMTPERIVFEALECAEHFAAGVMKPFTIMTHYKKGTSAYA